MDNVDTLQFRERINQRRNEGRPLTDDEIQCITNESTDLAGAAACRVLFLTPFRNADWFS